MTDQPDIKELHLRIQKLESMLEQAIAQRSTVADLSKEEIAAYRKVRDVIAADYGDFCGINDCFRCHIVRCSTLCDVRCFRPCDIECTCGPCRLGSIGGNLRRFSSLGE
jgi:hypothetical protein